MLTLPNKIETLSYSSFLFNLTLSRSSRSSNITMKMNIPIFSTHTIPQTFNILNQNLPTIYEHKCFNDKKLPFAKEVLRTEIGHLFEHVLIEYLYQFLTKSDNPRIILTGETSWDWTKQTKGLFKITITHPDFRSENLKLALNQAIKLTEQILNSELN